MHVIQSYPKLLGNWIVLVRSETLDEAIEGCARILDPEWVRIGAKPTDPLSLRIVRIDASGRLTRCFDVEGNPVLVTATPLAKAA